MPDEFHLCSLGWQMYDDWSAAEEKKKMVPGKIRRELFNAYVNHRRYCEECTKPYDPNRVEQAGGA